MSVLTLYHTPNWHTEDSSPQRKCKEQTCSVCTAPFAMTRGCSLEKRCHTCRLLGVSHPYHEPIEEVIRIKASGRRVMHHRVRGAHARKFMLYDEREVYKAVYFQSDMTYWGDTEVENEELNRQIDEVIEQLNEKEQTVLRMRFGLLEDESDRTLEEIGKELSVTRERVRQIESSAIKKLKHPKIGRKLKDYLDGKHKPNYKRR